MIWQTYGQGVATGRSTLELEKLRPPSESIQSGRCSFASNVDRSAPILHQTSLTKTYHVFILNTMPAGWDSMPPIALRLGFWHC
jgi:hypothetical protein